MTTLNAADKTALTRIFQAVREGLAASNSDEHPELSRLQSSSAAGGAVSALRDRFGITESTVHELQARILKEIPPTVLDEETAREIVAGIFATFPSIRENAAFMAGRAASPVLTAAVDAALKTTTDPPLGPDTSKKVKAARKPKRAKKSKVSA